MTAVVVVVLVALGAGCGVGWWRTARRVGALEARVARLDREVHDRVLPALDLSRRDSEEAVAAARLVSRAVGIEAPPPRLAGERVTGPVVRAVAFGAGARTALARFAADVAPAKRTRKGAARPLRIVGAAARGRGDTRPGSDGRTRPGSDGRTRRAG
jgi:hypothetical protein